MIANIVGQIAFLMVVAPLAAAASLLFVDPFWLMLAGYYIGVTSLSIAGIATPEELRDVGINNQSEG